MTIMPWVHAFIDVPSTRLEATRTFWSAVTGWPPGAPWTSHPEFVTLQPPGASPYVHLQRIDGPARIHLDLMADDIDAEAARLVRLGARRGPQHEWWQVMRSPGGLPFCLCRDADRRRPDPTSWPGGHRSRIAQVCLDVPDAGYDAELAFWTGATGWRPEPGRRPEYHRLVVPAESPLRFLVQRLDDTDPGQSTRAHIDIGADDIDAEVARVESLGARVLRRHEFWTVLSDPAGLPFCVTPQSPD